MTTIPMPPIGIRIGARSSAVVFTRATNPRRHRLPRGVGPRRDYVSVTYMSLGYGEDILASNWRSIAPMIATSGLFAFGWTTGVPFPSGERETSGRC